MPLRRRAHPSQNDVDDEFNNLEDSKEDKVQFATRAPTSKDKGRFWVTYTENSSTSMDFYIRHPVSGTWRKVAVS